MVASLRRARAHNFRLVLTKRTMLPSTSTLMSPNQDPMLADRHTKCVSFAFDELEIMGDWHVEQELAHLGGTCTADYDGLETSTSRDNQEKPSIARGPSRRKKRKAAGMPKRPLSAYNVFFQRQRQVIFEEHDNKIGFEALGKCIGERWRSLTKDERKEYETIAAKDAKRYRREMRAFEEMRRARITGNSVSSPDEPQERPLVIPWESSSEADSTEARQDQSPALASKQPSSTDLLSERNLVRLPAATHTIESESSSVHPSGQVMLGDTLQQQGTSTFEMLAASASAAFEAAVANEGPADAIMRTRTPQFLTPGQEVEFTDASGQRRKYTMRYQCYQMKREEAMEYLGQYTSGL